jgi:hypothetical protein
MTRSRMQWVEVCMDPSCPDYGMRAASDPAPVDWTCSQSGCGRRWTVEIEKRGGWFAAVCDEHADVLLADLPAAELVSMTGIEGLGPAPGGEGGHRSRRNARRKAAAKARRRSR